MLNTSGLLYLSARAVSAAGNLLAVAIFSRLAGPAEYGHYVLIFAWSLIVYGFGAQWMRFAYFGVYHHERFGEYVASLARLLGAGMAIVALVLAALGVFGFFEPSFLIAVFALVCGITVYEAAFEVARTLLNARGASLSMILRAVLMIGFGSVSLYARRRRARSRRRRSRVAHLIAAAPSLATFSNVRLSHFSRAASWHIVSYGWPLLLSFGVTAVGQSIDRLAARPLSRAGDARTLRRRRRHAAAEFHRARRGDHPVAGHGRQDPSQPRRHRKPPIKRCRWRSMPASPPRASAPRSSSSSAMSCCKRFCSRNSSRRPATSFRSWPSRSPSRPCAISISRR